MSVQNTVESLAVAAKKAARKLASLSTTSKNNVLLGMADALREQKVNPTSTSERPSSRSRKRIVSCYA